MVTIVSGYRAGLSLNSGEVLGFKDVIGGGLQGSKGQVVNVNIATGQVVLQDRDDLLVARGEDAALVRTYNSNGSLNDDNGDGWTSGITMLSVVGTPNAAGSAVMRVDPDGGAAGYAWNASRNLYVASDGAGAYDTIAYIAADGQFEWTDGATGATERFEGSGAYRLLARKDAAGNGVSYAYGANGFLSTVVAANGDSLAYDYAGNNLTQVRSTVGGVTTTRARYGYDTSNRLKTVTIDLTPGDNSIADGKAYQTTYTYDADSKRVASITQSDGTSVAFTYAYVEGGSYKVASVRDAAGQTTRFTYGARFTTVTDPLGLVTRYDYNGSNQITTITGPAVAGTSATRQFAYDAWDNVVAVTDGEGRTTTCDYDDRGNQVLQRDAGGGTVRRTFDARNQLLTETVYTQADPDGAGAQLPSGALTTRQVYDDLHRNELLFTISATGRVTEYRYDAFGQRTANITYAGTYALEGLAWASGPAKASLVAWAASQDLTATQRVDVAYDGRGQVQSRTTYAHIAADGTGIADGTQSVEHFVYDAAGLLLQTVSATGGTTTFTYDGLRRTLTATNALGQVAVTQHDDAGRRIVVTQSNGLVTTSTFDTVGRRTSVLQSSPATGALGETKFFYDADNRLRMTQDPTGVRSWTLYDEAGRKTADIDGNGSMTEYRYDRSDRVAATVTYGTAVNVGLLVDAGGLPIASATSASIRPAASNDDCFVWRQFDSAGRLAREATSTGMGATALATERRYDGASRLVQVIQYAMPASTGSDGPGVVSLPMSSPQDRITRNFYDNDGRLAGTLDAEGYLKVFRYTGAGQQSESICYATPTDATLRAAGTLAQLMPASAAADIRTLTLYDGKGQAIATVDGEGYLTENVYDADGNLAQTVRYATRVAGTPSASSTVAALRPASTPQDQATTRSYDALNRIAQETDVQGVVTQYAYDVAGNLVSSIRAPGTGEVRTLLAHYDVQGRLVGELSAEGASRLAGGQTQAQVDAIWAQYGTTHAYDAASRRISSTDPLGHRTLFFYTADGDLAFTVNALGEVRETRYDARGRVTDTIAYGNRMATAGWAGGLVTQPFTNAVAAIADPTVDSRTTVTYTRDSQVASTTDAEGNVTASAFNVFGEEISRQATGAGVNLLETYSVDRRGERTGTVRDAAGVNAVTSTVYDAFGRLVRSLDANGNVREQVFDRLGRVVTTRDPLQEQRSNNYDAFGRVLTQTDALGNATSYSYDPAARTMTVRTPEGVTTITAYTRHGQVQSITDGKGQVTSYRYDADGNLRQTLAPLTTTTSSYDALDRLADTTDANGHKVVYGYDAAGRVLTRTVDPGGLNLVTTYAYDGKGQRVSVTDPNLVVTTTGFDRNGRTTKVTVDPAGLNLQTVYSYDARGNVLTVRSPAGNITQYAYDALGRRKQERIDPSGLNLQRTWIYDRDGNVLVATDANGNVTRYAYDANNRLVFTVDAVGDVRENAYDAEGRIVKTVTYAAPLQPSSIPATPTEAQLRALVAPQPLQDAIEHRVYDNDGRLAATVDGTGAVVRFAYDANGNVVARTAYATRIPLAGWTPGTLPAPAADSAHDVVVRTVYDGLDRAIYSIDGVGAVVALAYDGNGNLVQRTAYASGIPTNTNLTPSAMAAAVAAVANPARDAVVRNTYDSAGRLAWTVDGTGAVTQNVYDGNGNVVRQVAYATPVAQGAAASSAVAAAGDRATSMAYDKANRLVFQVDALRGVTEQVFDLDSRVVRRTSYANPIPSTPPLGVSTTVDAIRTLLAPDTAIDRSSFFGYDAAGRQVIAADAVGAVTETKYDGVGNVVTLTARARTVDTTAPPAVPSAGWLQALVVADAADRVSRTAYDAAGRVVFTMDAVRAVTGNQFDGAGRLTRTTRYAALLRTTSTYDAAAISNALQADPEKDQVDGFAYNAAGQRIASTDAARNTETYAWDALGNKVSFTNKKGFTWTYAYDAGGRMVSETSPELQLTSAAPAPDGTIALTSDANGSVVTRMAYDALGNLLARTEAAGRPEERTTRYEYDALGRQVRVVFPVVGVYDRATDTLATGGFGLAPRAETQRPLETRTFYDALGNAVANRDVGDALGQKVYDALGRVLYEVDALGYVTGYTRNAFGDVTSLTRYAVATTLAGANVTQAGQAASKAMVDAAVGAPGVDHSKDRTLLSTYDRAGRLLEKTEPIVFMADGGQSGNFGAVTRYAYDAFGEQVQEQKLRFGSTWVTTTHYFDQVGHDIATVDAMGYLTERKYDLLGNLTSSSEYAAAVPAAWRPGTPPATAIDDRVTTYAYDTLNRKRSETRKGVETSAASDGTSTRADLTTTYEYDAVGNQTRVVDAGHNATISYYDALGRVRAIVAPSRSSAFDGSTLTPVTTFLRDAYGNVVARTDYAGSASSVTATTFTAPVASGDDRTVYAAYDKLGRSTQSTDAMHNQQFVSYDAYGHVAKKWQAVSANDGTTRTVYEQDEYDRLGRVVAVRTPAAGALSGGQIDVAPASSALSTVTYNAFGEVTAKGTEQGVQEYFEYDNAGRLWRTNSGDGVDHISLYDALGNVAADIRSAGTLDVKTFANAEAAASANPNTRRVDMEYDALGRVTRKVESARQDVQGGAAVQRQFTSAAILANAEVTSLVVPGKTSKVALTWNLSQLGSGDLKVTIEYRTAFHATGESDVDGRPIIVPGSVMRSYTSDLLNGDTAAQGATLQWIDMAGTVDTGISAVTRMVVSKKDRFGNWVTVLDQAPGYGPNEVVLGAPPDPNATTTLKLRVAGSAGDTGWWQAGLDNFGAGLRFNAAGLGLGNYEYQVVVTATDGSSRVTAKGLLAVTSPPLNTIPTTLSYGQSFVPAGVLAWSSPGTSYAQVFRYRPSGSTGAWSTLAVSAARSDLDGVNTSGLAAGTYQFELLWSLNSQNVPSSHATGTFTVVAAKPAVWVPPVNLPNITGLRISTVPVVVVFGGGGSRQVPIVTWNAAGATVARYRVPGGAWTSVAINNDSQQLGDYGTYTGTQSALIDVAPGTYQLEILVGSPPTAQATANVSVYAKTPDTYTTVYVQVWRSVPVVAYYVGQTPVYAVDENGNTIYQSVLVTEAHQQTVPGTIPPPTISVTTPPYTPGYWIPAQSAQYGVSVTTAPGTTALSTADGSTIAQSIVQNGDVRSLRPTVQQKTDRWGNVTEITDPRAAYWKTTYRYNANNQMVQQVLPDGASTSIYYDALGRQVAVRDANGHVNGLVYDAAGDLIRELHADGGVVGNAFNAFGDRVSTADAMNNVAGFSYDKLGHLLQTTRASASVYGVDGTNQLVALGTRNIVDSWTYDQLGRKLKQTNGNGETISYAYDLAGNLVETKQPMGQAVRAAYDAQGRKIAELDANGRTSTWAYDYFGRITGHTDLGGSKYEYTYDNARQLTRQTSSRGQSITYSYDGAGQVTTIRDSADDKTTTYVYDLSGRKVRERVVQGGITYQDNNMAYDARGNLRDVADARAHVSMAYDAAGNRTFVGTYVDYMGTGGEGATGSSRYYLYDAMNRQVAVDAVDAAGNRGTQGHTLTYDKNGNRTSDTYYGSKIVPVGPVITGTNEDGSPIYSDETGFTSTTGDTTEIYSYDRLNRLLAVQKDGMQTDVRYYDGADRVVQQGISALPTTYAAIITQALAPGQSNGLETRINRYDANGRLLHQRLLKNDGSAKTDISWDSSENLNGYVANGYDAAGNVLGYVVDNHEGAGTDKFTTASMHYFEGYQAGTVQGVSTKRNPGSSTQQYDVNGFLVGVVDSTQGANNRTFVNDASGKALYVNQGGNVQRQLVVNGEVLGIYGAGVDPKHPASGYDNNPNFANVVDFDFGYAPIKENYPLASPGAYTVHVGDTLQSIAQAAYGDSSLWYRIADANGLASPESLKVGQTLNIPNRVSTINNNASTFKPYDPSKIEGDKTPSLATPKPKKGSGWKQLIVVIVAIVVAIFTAGAMAIALNAASGLSPFAAGMAALGGGSATVGGVAVSLTGGALGSAGATAAVSAAIGGAVGSMASQLVGIGVGVQERFDWRSVALSAVSAGMAAGTGAILGKAAGPLSIAVRSGAANIATQGIAVMTGLQPRFDWRGVAASAVGAGVGAAAGQAVGLDNAIASNNFAEGLAKQMIAGVAAGSVAAVMRGGRVVVQQVAVDAFGNALGQSIAEVMTDSPTRVTGSEKNGVSSQPPSLLDLEEVSLVAGSMQSRPSPTTRFTAAWSGILTATQTGAPEYATPIQQQQAAEVYQESLGAFKEVVEYTAQNPKLRDALISRYEAWANEGGWLKPPMVQNAGVALGTLLSNPTPESAVALSMAMSGSHGIRTSPAAMGGLLGMLALANDSDRIAANLDSMARSSVEYDGKSYNSFQFGGVKSNAMDVASVLAFPVGSGATRAVTLAGRVALAAGTALVNGVNFLAQATLGTATGRAAIMSVALRTAEVGGLPAPVPGLGIYSTLRRAAANEPTAEPVSPSPSNATRIGVIRRNDADMRQLRDLWDDLGYGEILSTTNRQFIANGLRPKVDEAWIKVFPEDAGLIGERITPHHIAGLPVTIPLPKTRHMDAHMPGGFRYNPGGPGAAVPLYPAKPQGAINP